MVVGWKCKICEKINMGYVGTCGCGELKENGIQLSEEELKSEQDNKKNKEKKKWQCSDCLRINDRDYCICGHIRTNSDRYLVEDVSSESQMSAFQSNEIICSYNKKNFFIVIIIVVAIVSIVSGILKTKNNVKPGSEIEGTYINRYNNTYILEDGIGVHVMFGFRYKYSYIYDEKTKILYIGELAYQYGVTENGTEYLLRIMEYKPGQEYEIYYKQ